MIYSVMLTGVAPGSFYPRHGAGKRQRAHFDGLPVGFVAEAVTTLGAEAEEGFVTYHVMNPHDDGIGIDEYVDWLIEAGYPIERVEDFWRVGAPRTVCGRRRSDKLRTPCPVVARGAQGRPGLPAAGTHARAPASTERFRAAVRAARIGCGGDIPHVTREVITRYATDLEALKLL